MVGDSSSSSSSSGDVETAEGNVSNTNNEVEKRKVLTTPAVRRLAGEHKLDLSQVKATGPQGRILKGDILAYLGGQQSSPLTAPTAVEPVLRSSKQTIMPSPATDRVEVLKGVRKIMFKSMTNSLVFICKRLKKWIPNISKLFEFSRKSLTLHSATRST